MGHRNADIDSLGAAVGIARIAATLEKKVHIVLSDSFPDILQNLRNHLASGGSIGFHIR